MTTCTCKTCSCSEEEVAAFHKATSPLLADKIRATFAPKGEGEYDLIYLVGRVFYHDSADTQALFDRALDWVEQEGMSVLEIRYDNSSNPYTESVTVIAERL